MLCKVDVVMKVVDCSIYLNELRREYEKMSLVWAKKQMAQPKAIGQKFVY